MTLNELNNRIFPRDAVLPVEAVADYLQMKVEDGKICPYAFDELDSAAKTRALKHAQKYRGEQFDNDDLTSWFKEELKYSHGFDEVECYWSLSHCQGDGVAFYGRFDVEEVAKHDPDTKRLLEELQTFPGFDVCALSAEILGRNSHYHHWNSMQVEVEYGQRLETEDGEPVPEDVDALFDRTLSRLSDHLLQLVKDISRKLEQLGYHSIDDFHSDERIIEELQDQSFLRSGELA